MRFYLACSTSKFSLKLDRFGFFDAPSFRRCIFCVCFFAMSIPSAISQPKTDSLDEAIAVIDVWLEAEKDFRKIPGISVAIVKDQQMVWSKGYGYADVSKKVPMDPGTLCSICSISKLFTSIAIMQLWELGKIRLDDSVSMYLPEYKLQQDFESVPITIRALLTHSAGLPASLNNPTGPTPINFQPKRKSTTAWESNTPSTHLLPCINTVTSG